MQSNLQFDRVSMLIQGTFAVFQWTPETKREPRILFTAPGYGFRTAAGYAGRCGEAGFVHLRMGLPRCGRFVAPALGP